LLHFEARGIHDVWDVTAIALGSLAVQAFTGAESVAPGAALALEGVASSLDRPDYRALADALDHTRIGTAHPPDVALKAYIAQLSSTLLPRPAASARAFLASFLEGTRSAHQSLTTRLFQNVILGGEAFEASYGLPSLYRGESLLDLEDRILIAPDTVQVILTGRSRRTWLAGIYSARPSLPPREVGPAPGQGYSPEAEWVTGKSGLSDLPCIAMGMMDWLGRQVGVPVEGLTKPNTTQALAALLCVLNGGRQEDALRTAYRIDPRGLDVKDTALARCLEQPVDLIVFEDTVSGIKPLVEVASRLNSAGGQVRLRALGIAQDATKVAALAPYCESVFGSVNEAVAAAVAPSTTPALLW
ncbi:MAG TPA: hypothetical protein VEY30_03470, partial [Myxococcaceae bacterium]|nr:hypothetical protein [Myxococcaceae bacterium]